MILFFILIAIIPIAALSAVFSFTVIKFREEMSIVYEGFVPNLAILSKNKSDLSAIRSDLVQFTSTSGDQKTAWVMHMLELKSGIDGSMDDYKRIEDLPKAFDQPFGFVFPVDSFNVSKLASDETLLVSDINRQWSAYSSRVEDLSILVSDSSFSVQANAEAGQLTTQADRLISSYDSLYSVNVQIGDALWERSLQTMQLAFLYGGFAPAISAAAATAAAILVSKRVVLGDLVRMTKMELIETTLRDLIGGGADALLTMIKTQMSEEQPQRPVAEVATAVVPSQEDIVIGGAKKEEQLQGAGGTKAFVEEYEPLAAAGQELKGKLVMINYGGNSRPSPQATWTMSQIFEAPKLILPTRRGSNFYHQAQGKYAVCVLGDPAQDGEKAGERVVPSADEAKLGQAVEELVRENPASTVLVDNATEPIYTLGFEKVFSLLRKMADVMAYEDSSVVVLINKKAHEPRMIEAIGNISNKFID
jgi:hypothetical protein